LVVPDPVIIGCPHLEPILPGRNIGVRRLPLMTRIVPKFIKSMKDIAIFVVLRKGEVQGYVIYGKNILIMVQFYCGMVDKVSGNHGPDGIQIVFFTVERRNPRNDHGRDYAILFYLFGEKTIYPVRASKIKFPVAAPQGTIFVELPL